MIITSKVSFPVAIPVYANGIVCIFPISNTNTTLCVNAIIFDDPVGEFEHASPTLASFQQNKDKCTIWLQSMSKTDPGEISHVGIAMIIGI